MIFYVLWGLTITVLGVAVVLRYRENDKADHAKCIALISSVTSNRVAAQTLRDAAERYASIDGQAELVRIRNSLYGGTSVPIPSLWMREQADKIEAGS